MVRDCDYLGARRNWRYTRTGGCRRRARLYCSKRRRVSKTNATAVSRQRTTHCRHPHYSFATSPSASPDALTCLSSTWRRRSGGWQYWRMSVERELCWAREIAETRRLQGAASDRKPGRRADAFIRRAGQASWPLVVWGDCCFVAFLTQLAEPSTATPLKKRHNPFALRGKTRRFRLWPMSRSLWSVGLDV